MTQSKEINTYMNQLGSEAKEASLILAQASLEQKNEALSCISEQIESDRDKILSINKIPVQGKHNLQNSMAAISVAQILKISNQKIKESLKTFKSIPQS